MDNKYEKVVFQLYELFTHYKPAECKDQLWKLFALTVSGGFNNQPVESREDLLAFYEHVQQLFNVLETLELEHQSEYNSKANKAFSIKKTHLNC